MRLNFFISCVVLLTRCNVNSQTLKAEIVTKLSESVFLASPVYDGINTIYILGGSNGGGGDSNSFFSAFDPDSEAFNKVRNLYYGTAAGQTAAQIDSQGRIFHFVKTSDIVQSFDPKVSNESARITRLANKIQIPSTILLENDVIAVLGGDETGRAFMTFDTKTNESIISAKELPFPLDKSVATRIGNKAIVIGAYNKSYPSAFELNLDTLEVEQQVGDDFPFMEFSPGIAQHNGYVYVIGGYNITEESQTPTTGIIQLDPNTFNWRFIPVEGFVIQPDQFFDVAPATVIVEKYNRIYFFGGYARNVGNSSVTLRNEIWFIDLTPLDGEPPGSTTLPSTTSTLNPNVFSCTNRTDGTYPHPYECDMFIICHNGETQMFDCPPPLLFDPEGHRCDLPESVDCNLTCTDKPDDQYPHPQDCALFIICHDGQLDVFRCPEPLLFDPESKSCNLPELVNCSSSWKFRF